jgi:hypothetical protein
LFTIIKNLLFEYSNIQITFRHFSFVDFCRLVSIIRFVRSRQYGLLYHYMFMVIQVFLTYIYSKDFKSLNFIYTSTSTVVQNLLENQHLIVTCLICSLLLSHSREKLLITALASFAVLMGIPIVITIKLLVVRLNLRFWKSYLYSYRYI